MNPKVTAFNVRNEPWTPILEKMRQLLLEANLTEELKWGKPSYSFEGGNVAILQPFKGFCALMFYKGALLKDPEGILVFPGENAQSGKQARFTDVEQVDEMVPVLKAYIQEAIEVEKSGAKVQLKTIDEHPVPDELLAKFEEMPAFKDAFKSLTPGRQRAYLLQFNAPKQSKTREARIEKYLPQIMEGKGLND